MQEVLERALQIQEREYGKDHREVATTLMQLGSMYGAIGDAERQRDI